MEKIIGYTKKDFKLRWYSGSGAGGQHRNKHQNCCHITHVESGMSERGTANKSRVANQRDAFTKLANKIIPWKLAQMEINVNINKTVIRNYNGYRNEVHDKESGLKTSYDKVVVDGNLGEHIESRALVCNVNDKITTY